MVPFLDRKIIESRTFKDEKWGQLLGDVVLNGKHSFGIIQFWAPNWHGGWAPQWTRKSDDTCWDELK